MSGLNPTPKPFRQVFISDDELEYGLTVRPNLPRLTDEQTATWEPVPWEGIATLKADPEALAERFGLVFQHTVDGLDLLRLAVVDLEDGLRVAFKRHRGIGSGTYVDVLPQQFIDDETMRRDPFGAMDRIQDDVLQQIMDGLGLVSDDFDWIRPKSDA
jgi:hypothetical protein